MKHKIKKMLMVIILIASMLVQTGHVAFVKADDELKSDVTITELFIEDTQSEYEANSQFNVTISWDASAYQDKLTKGDYFEITLPDNMVFKSGDTTAGFPQLDHDGNVIAEVIVAPQEMGGGVASVTFTDYVEGRSDIQGTFSLSAEFAMEKINVGEENTFVVSIGNSVKEIVLNIKDNVEDTPPVTEPLETVVEQDGEVGLEVLANENVTEVKIDDIEIVDVDDADLSLADAEIQPVLLNEAVPTRAGSYVAPDGGKVDDDLARSGKLGIAKYFHIFANKATLSTHTNGNVAVGHLTANVNFGTNIKGDGHVPKDIHYIQDTDKLANSSFVAPSGGRTNKVVFGENVQLTLVGNGNKIAANGFELGNLKKEEAFQDKNGNKYIDFGAEFAKLKASSDELATLSQTDGVEKNFADENNRYFDVNKAKVTTLGTVILTKTNQEGELLDNVEFSLYKVGNPNPIKMGLKTSNGKITVSGLEKGEYYFKETATLEGYVLNTDEHKFTIADGNLSASGTIYLDVTREEIEKDRPLKIKGIDKNGPSIVVNVDTNSAQTVNVRSEIKLIYTDGTDRPSMETENFSDALVLWNFKNRADGQVININHARFMGSILAIGNTINIGQNVDGSIIADTVNVIGGETHRRDYQEKEGNSGNPAKVNVVNEKKTVEKTVVEGTKIWEDNNNQDGKRPGSVTIQLYADGVKVDGKTLTLTEATQWSGSFTDLDEFKNGTKIVYTIKEEPVGNGYISVVSGDVNTGLVVTNTRKPSLPNTGYESSTTLLAGLVGLSGVALLLFGLFDKKNKQNKH